MFVVSVKIASVCRYYSCRRRARNKMLTLSPKLGRRVAVVAASCGSGKSHLAQTLARIWQVKYISDDSLLWRDGYQDTGEPRIVPRAERLTLYQAALSGDSWIIDSGYFRDRFPHHRYFAERADTIIFIDLPIFQTFIQLISRTFRRVWLQEQLHGTSNVETWRRAFFSSSSLLWQFILSRGFAENQEFYQDFLRHKAQGYHTVWLRSRHEVDAFVWCEATKMDGGRQ
jgi:adenylate kinase family enzyme